MTCLFCDNPLDPPRARPAFDSWLGRLWRICPSCRRWNTVPLEQRWADLEAFEHAARRGRVRLRTEHLDLVDTERGQLVRVGRAPRPELAVWRYGDLVPRPRPEGLGGWLHRLLEELPSSPFGYGGGYGEFGGRIVQQRWLASPFLFTSVARESAALGELGPERRLAFGFALDEEAEAELLETEWREAEELAAVVDGSLTEVPGFEEFRRRVLEG